MGHSIYLLSSNILIIYTNTDTFQQRKTSVVVEIFSSDQRLFCICFKSKYYKEHEKWQKGVFLSCANRRETRWIENMGRPVLDVTVAWSSLQPG